MGRHELNLIGELLWMRYLEVRCLIKCGDSSSAEALKEWLRWPLRAYSWGVPINKTQYLMGNRGQRHKFVIKAFLKHLIILYCWQWYLAQQHTARFVAFLSNTVVTRTRYNVALFVLCLSCLICELAEVSRSAELSIKNSALGEQQTHFVRR